eukprot:TRINITY_DN1451_c0_g1_i2.p1 TRINITY_DN1451_c0_g1~~TRINITY_DN1451_c0_g1_i2.p1  ORF type:complete len:1088 (-),score=163.20 TRINITY_DN1451_c0_g1_i2:61-3324(-)
MAESSVRNTSAIISFALIFSAIFCGCVQSQPIHVWADAPAGGDGSAQSPYKTLTEAFALASNTSRDQILVRQGSYREALISGIGKSVTVTGTDSNVTLSCLSAGPVWRGTTSADELILSNVTLTGCVAQGVLSAITNASITVRSVKIQNTGPAAAVVGGILIDSARLKVQNSVFSSVRGGAIVIRQQFTSDSVVSIENTRFYNCTYGNGNAIVDVPSTSNKISLTVKDSIFIDNQRAINLRSGNLTVTGTSFYNSDSNTTSDSTVNAITCYVGATTLLGQSGNTFCGENGNTVSCGAWPTPLRTRFDGCKVCMGNNQHKDCKGECFGDGTNCYTGKTLYVKNGADAALATGSYALPYPSISAAVTAANYWGDTIVLFEGTYTGDNNTMITFAEKTITLKSMYGQPDNTTLNCVGTSRSVFRMTTGESYDSVIEGVKISGCVGNAFAFYLSGSSPTIKNCHITGGIRPRGGGIFLEDSFSVVDRCRIESNRATQTGGGIAIARVGPFLNSDVRIKSTIFIGNNATTAGGGVWLQSGNYLELRDSVFVQNSLDSTSFGSTVYLESSTAILNAFNNSFYSTFASDFVVLYCPSSVITQSSNQFCGTNTKVNCSSWTSTPAAQISDCNICGGSSNVGKDCNGTCFGNRLNDTFGGCCLLKERDCEGRCGGPAIYDSFGTCCNASLIDCSGHCFGTKVYDNATTTPRGCCERADFDCLDLCFGGHVEDKSTPAKCCFRSEFDCKELCFGAHINDTATPPNCCLQGEMDCAKICFGQRFNDTATPPNCCLLGEMDCAEICFGPHENDDTLPEPDCCLPGEMDCLHYCNGPHKNDTSTPQPVCCLPGQIDCKGHCFGLYLNDTSPAHECCLPPLDCGGYCSGVHSNSSNGTCCLTATQDCFGICGGDGVEDFNSTCCHPGEKTSCNVCFGSEAACALTTGIPPVATTNSITTNSVTITTGSVSVVTSEDDDATSSSESSSLTTEGHVAGPSSSEPWFTETRIYIIVGVAAFLLVLILVVLIVALLLKRNKRKRVKPSRQSVELAATGVATTSPNHMSGISSSSSSTESDSDDSSSGDDESESSRSQNSAAKEIY